MPAPRATVKPKVDVAASMRAIVAELSADLIERTRQIEAVAITLLAGKNAILLGPPGAAKSMLIKSFAARFPGCQDFEILLDKQLGKEELFGQYDLPAYDKHGVWERDIAGMLPEAHIAFIDEVGKAGPAVLNPMLKILNEREYKHGKNLINVPLLSAFGASNELLEDELGAFWDRFLIRFYVNYVREPANFAQLMQSAVVSTKTVAAWTTIDLHDLERAVRVEVPAIAIPDEIAVKIVTLWQQCNNEGMEISDRRWKESMRVLQASAYLAGRSAVDEDDMLVLRDVLWSKPEEQTKVNELVSAFASALVRQCIAYEQTVDQWNTKLSEVLDDDDKSAAERSRLGVEINGKIAAARLEMIALKAQAIKDKKDTTRLDRVAGEYRAVEKKIFMTVMRMKESHAEASVTKSWEDYA